MKKILTCTILIIVFIITYLLQSNFFNWFTIAGVKPNLFIVLVVIIGLFSGKTKGAIFGMLFGILLDFYTGDMIGVSGIMLGIVGYAGGYLDKNFSKDSKLTLIIIIAVATAVFELGAYLILCSIDKVSINIISFIKILGIEIIYNIILTIILNPVLQRGGFRMENIFKGNRVFTRYF